MGLDLRKLIKECVTQVLKEELEDPLYVEYHSQRKGEEPFTMNGQKFEYVNAIYPNGKIDIGVYAFAGDMVYSYNAFRQMHGIQEGNPATWYKKGAKGPRKLSDLQTECPMCHGRGKSLQDPRYKCTSCGGTGKMSPPKFTEAFDPTSVGPNPEATEGLSDGNPYAAWNAKMRQMENLPPSGEEKYYKQQPGGSMGASNTTTLAKEAMGRYAQEAGADGFGPEEFAVNSKIKEAKPRPLDANIQADLTSDSTGNSDYDYYIKKSRIPLGWQKVVFMKLKGYTDQELASILNVSDSRINAVYNGALKRIQQFIQQSDKS